MGNTTSSSPTPSSGKPRWPDYPVGKFDRVRVREDYTNLHGVLIAKEGAEGYIRSEDRGEYGVDFDPEDERVIVSYSGESAPTGHPTRVHRFHDIPVHFLYIVLPDKPNA